MRFGSSPDTWNPLTDPGGERVLVFINQRVRENTIIYDGSSSSIIVTIATDAETTWAIATIDTAGADVNSLLIDDTGNQIYH